MRPAKKQLRKEFEDQLRSGKKVLPVDTSARLLEALHEKITAGYSSAQEDSPGHQSGTPGFQPQAPVRRLRLPVAAIWSAAALFLLCTVAIWLLCRHVTPGTKPAADNGLVIRTNHSTHELSLTLPDSSTVVLSPGSTVRYASAFGPGHRELRLSGKALFGVSAAADRPFTVITGDINTTALGTRFVISTEMPGKIQVQLLEGKVVVRPSVRTLTMKEVYLQPGQQFLLDRQSHVFTVTEYRQDQTPAETTPKKRATSAVNGVPTNNSILEFNQEPLPNVLTSIGRQYGVVFRLNGRGFNTTLVTGRFLPSDSLKSVLSMLGSINDLSFTETNDTIVVAPAHP